MRTTILPAALALVALGCAGATAQTATAPAPVTARTQRSTAEAIRVAARVFAGQGFDIIQSDATGGLLSVERKDSPKNLRPGVSCRWPLNSMASTMGEATLHISLTFAKADSGASVTAASRVRTDYSKTIGPFKSTPASDTDCVTTGVFEKRTLDSLAARL